MQALHDAARGQPGHPGSVPRRPDLRAGGRRSTFSSTPQRHRRLLRRASMERLPVEPAIANRVREFTQLRL